MERQKQDKIRTLAENETFKYLGIFGGWHYQTSGIERKRLRKNISGEVENYSRQNYVAEALSKE